MSNQQITKVASTSNGKVMVFLYVSTAGISMEMFIFHVRAYISKFDPSHTFMCDNVDVLVSKNIFGEPETTFSYRHKMPICKNGDRYNVDDYPSIVIYSQ